MRERKHGAVDRTQGIRTTTNLQPSCELYLLASDCGYPSTLTSITKVTIFVIVNNNYPPKVIHPSSNSLCLTVPTDTIAGTVVTKIYAIDEDSRLNSEVTYTCCGSGACAKHHYLHGGSQVRKHHHSRATSTEGLGDASSADCGQRWRGTDS